MAQDDDNKPKVGYKNPPKHTQFTSENARENQLKGVEAKAIKREEQNQIEKTLRAIKEIGAPHPLDVMESLMTDAILRGDADFALKVSKELAQYKAPKLSSVESKATIKDLTQSSDGDLLKRAQAMGIDVSQLGFLKDSSDEDEQRPQ